jgi:hypothetical protein
VSDTLFTFRILETKKLFPRPIRCDRKNFKMTGHVEICLIYYRIIQGKSDSCRVIDLVERIAVVTVDFFFQKFYYREC